KSIGLFTGAGRSPLLEVGRAGAGPMYRERERAVADQNAPGSLLVLASVSLVVGAAAGLVGALFRLTLREADHVRDALLTWAHGVGPAGLLPVLAACAAATAAAAWLVRRFAPHASRRRSPHVEAVLHEEIPQARFRLTPVKFVGGVLSMGAGLALGREGPSVQMGASLAHFLGKIFRRPWPDCQVLLAAGAGAGLATAFNAPVADLVGKRVSRELSTPADPADRTPAGTPPQ